MIINSAIIPPQVLMICIVCVMQCSVHKETAQQSSLYPAATSSTTDLLPLIRPNVSFYLSLSLILAVSDNIIHMAVYVSLYMCVSGTGTPPPPHHAPATQPQHIYTHQPHHIAHTVR